MKIACTLSLALLALSMGCGRHPLVYDSIHEAAAKGNLADVKRHIQRGAAINARDEYGKTPLMNACEHSSSKVVIYLVDSGADINLWDKTGKTPVIYAALSGNKSLLEYLVQQDASVISKDQEGMTPLMYASQRGEHEAVYFLVNKGADIHAADNNGMTALMYASSRGDMNVITFLVDRGADVNAADKRGDTALSRVVMTSYNSEMAEYLISHGAYVDTIDNDGITPLLCAVMFDKLDMVKLLVNNGANIHKKCKGGMTPYKYSDLGIRDDILNYFNELQSPIN